MIKSDPDSAIPTSPVKNRVTGVILAGGRGKRMGSVDKGLQPFNGKPLALHGIERIVPQVKTIIINANRNGETYRSFGFPVFPDDPLDYSGPLAGFLTGLRHCETPFLVTLPCDTPFVSTGLVEKLATALEKEQAELAIASVRINGICRTQPVFSLMKQSVRPHLESFLEKGGRKIDDWYSTLKVVEVCFDDPHAFENINTPDDLQKFQHPSQPSSPTRTEKHT